MLPGSFQMPAALILLVGGLCSCFAGYRIFRWVLAFFGFVFGALFVGAAMGMDVEACVAASMESPLAIEFRRRLFSKIVPNIKSLGLLSRRQRERFQELGILEFEGHTTSDVDHDIEEERRIRAGEAESAAA